MNTEDYKELYELALEELDAARVCILTLRQQLAVATARNEQLSADVQFGNRA